MYEGASTLFGRWQLPAIQQTAAMLATALRDGRRVDPGTPAPDLSARRRRQGRQVRPGTDEPHSHHEIGEQLSFAWDGRVATAEFVGVHPGNDPRRGGTYFEVQKREGLYWRRVADDGDWSTRLYWTRLPSPRGTTRSVVRIQWHLPDDTPPGRYRFVYRGNTGLARFQGKSQEFDVTDEEP